jgi:tape measure domain-containing protein
VQENILIKVGADISNFASNMSKVSRGLSGIGNGYDTASKKQGSFIRGMSQIASGIGVYAAVSKGIGMISSSLDGAISRYDTLNNFPRVLQQIGFSADDSEKAISKLSDGIQGLPTTLDDVASTAQRIAVMTGDLDGAVDTTLALNNAFISSGSNAVDASRGLEQYVQMLSRGEVGLEEWRTLQETMGVALNDVAKAFGFAGKSAQNDLYDALKYGEITMEEFNAKLIELNDGTNGFAERAKTASGGIRTAWTNMQTAVVRGTTNIIDAIDEALSETRFKSIENIITNMGNTFFKVLDGIARAIPKVAKGIRDFREALEPWIPIINTITGLLIGLGVGLAVFKTSTYLMGVLSLTRALSALKSAIESVAIASMLLWDTLKANPVIAIISILAGLAAMFAYLWKTNEGFRNTVLATWERIQGIFDRVKQVTTGLVENFTAISKTMATMAANNVKAFADKTAEKFSNTIARLGQAANTAKEFLKNLWASIDVKELLMSLINPLITISTLFLGLASPIGWLLKSVVALTTQTSLFSDVMSMLRGEMSFGEVVNNLAGDISNLITKMAETTATMITKGAEMITAFLQGLSAKLPEIIESGVTIVTSLIEGMTQNLTTMITFGVELITKIIEAIVGALPRLTEAGVEILTQMIDAIVVALPQIMQVGAQIITALVEAITMAIPALILVAGQIIQTLVTTTITMLPLIIQTFITLAQTIISTVVSMLPLIIETFVTLVQTIVDTMISMLPMIIDTSITLLTTIIETIAANLALIIDAGIQILTALIEGLLTVLPALLDAALTILQALVQIVIDNLPLIITAGIKILMALIDGIMTILPSLIGAAVVLIYTLADTLIKNLPKIIDAGLKILLAVIEGILDMLPELVTTGVNLIVKLAQTLIENLPKIIEAGIKVITSIIKGIGEALPDLLKAGVGVIKDLASELLAKAPGMLKDVGSAVVDGIWSGIKGAGDWLKDKVSGFFGGIVDWGKKALGINSPSRVIRDQVGRWIPAGLVDGINSEKNDVIKAAEQMAQWATPDVPDVAIAYSTPSGLRSSLSSAVSGTVDVNTRDDMLAAAINRLEQSLDGMTIVMDGERVGQLVRPRVNEGNAVDALVRRYFD